MYKNYIFDLYGTLVDINTNESQIGLWKKMEEFYGFYGAEYTARELRDSYRKICVEKEKKISKTDYAEISVEYVFKELFTRKGVNVSLDTCKVAAKFFRIMSTKYIKLYPGAAEFLDRLKEKGKNVYLLSNAQAVFTANEIEYLGIDKKFDAMLLSSREKYRKPSKRFFNALIEGYGLDVKESIMIGNDWKSDIEGANNVGMDSLYMHTNISPQDTVLEEVESKFIVDGADYDKIFELIVK